MLDKRWSPQQISARLVVEFPDDLEMRVYTRRSTSRCSSSHEERCVRSQSRACELTEPVVADTAARTRVAT